MQPVLSMKARLGNGWALPLAMFVVWQFLLLPYIGSLGGFGGMVAFLAAFAIVPAVAVLNLWVLAFRWRGHFRTFLAGLALPFVVGVAQAVLFHGMARGSRWVEAVVRHPLAYLFLAALVAPLVVAVVVVLRRRAGTSA